MMTREEVTKYAESKKMMLELLIYNDGCKYGNYAMYSAELSFINAVLTALRPVSREEVEKAWRGEWKRTHSSDNFWTEVWVCSRCGLEDDNGDCFDFCPSCGAPMTDEAVEMVMERLEAMKDG